MNNPTPDMTGMPQWLRDAAKQADADHAAEMELINERKAALDRVQGQLDYVRVVLTAGI